LETPAFRACRPRIPPVALVERRVGDDGGCCDTAAGASFYSTAGPSMRTGRERSVSTSRDPKQSGVAKKAIARTKAILLRHLYVFGYQTPRQTEHSSPGASDDEDSAAVLVSVGTYPDWSSWP
jgi:hypothetical protein